MARFNVDFSEETAELLERLAKERKASKADVIRKALTLERWVTETLASGSKLVVQDPDGTQREVVVK
jgi:hypothetical protein